MRLYVHWKYEMFARPMSHDDLVQIQYLFGPNTDIAAQGKSQITNHKSQIRGNADELILATVHGRPVTRQDLADALGVAPRALTAALRGLVRAKRIKPVDYSGKTFYEPA